MNKMQLALVVLLAALFAGACSIATPQITASDPTAASETTSPLCLAIENIVAFPFDTYSFGDPTATSDASAIRSAASSYRAVAATLPDDAPYIIATFFSAAPDTVEETIGQSLADLATDPDRLSDVIVLGSIDMQDVERYVAAKCPATEFPKQPFTPLFTVAPHPLAAPSQVEFCAGLARFASNFDALDNGSVQGFDDRLAIINTANGALLEALHRMEVDTPRRTAAYLRLVSFTLTNIQTPPEETRFADGLLWNLNKDSLSDELQSLCPDVEDPWVWLLPFFNGSDPASSPSGDEGIVIELGTPDGTVTVGGVVFNLDYGEFERHGSSDGADGGRALFVRLQISFDPPPGDEQIPVPADVVLVAPDGTEFPADAGQTIYPPVSGIRFSVDREVRTLAGWTLRSGDAALDLG